MTHQPALGLRLKALRVSRGLSLKEVGSETGVSSSFISMVETGRNDLSVGRLVMLADFYGVSLGDVLPTGDAGEPVVLRRADRKALDFATDRVTTEPLASWRHGEVSTGFVRFDVGGELAGARAEAGPAFLLVLRGELMIDFAEESSVVLGEGDSVWFEASRRHRQVNIGDREAEVVTFKNLSRRHV